MLTICEQRNDCLINAYFYLGGRMLDDSTHMLLNIVDIFLQK